MKRAHRTFWTPLTLLGIALAISALAVAAAPGPHGPATGMTAGAPTRTLTPDQLRQLDEVRLTVEKKALPLERKIQARRMELEAIMSSPDPDLDRARALRREIRKLEEQLDDVWAEASAEVSSFLTPEQRAQYADPAAWLMGTSSWYDGWSCPWDRAGRYGSGWHDRCRWRPAANGGWSTTRGMGMRMMDTCCY